MRSLDNRTAWGRPAVIDLPGLACESCQKTSEGRSARPISMGFGTRQIELRTVSCDLATSAAGCYTMRAPRTDCSCGAKCAGRVSLGRVDSLASCAEAVRSAPSCGAVFDFDGIDTSSAEPGSGDAPTASDGAGFCSCGKAGTSNEECGASVDALCRERIGGLTLADVPGLADEGAVVEATERELRLLRALLPLAAARTAMCTAGGAVDAESTPVSECP